MRRVRHLLEAKAPEVFAIGPDAPVIDAISRMASITGASARWW